MVLALKFSNGPLENLINCVITKKHGASFHIHKAYMGQKFAWKLLSRRFIGNLAYFEVILTSDRLFQKS